MRLFTRILLMDGDMISKSMDLDVTIHNLAKDQEIRVFGIKTKIVDISHTIFDNAGVMNIIQVREIKPVRV